MKLKAELDQASLRAVHERLVRVKTGTYTGLRNRFEAWGESWQRGVGARFTGTTGPQSLRNRSGRLSGSINHAVTGSSLGDLTLEMASKGAIHARIHEYGGEIRPKNARFLTIPTPANLTGAGNARFPSAKEFISEHPGETFFLRTEAAGKDNLLLMWSKPGASHRKSSGVKGKGNAVPMFVLVKKVDLPGPKSPSKKGPSRLGFHDTWAAGEAKRRADLARLAGLLAKGISSAVGGAAA